MSFIIILFLFTSSTNFKIIAFGTEMFTLDFHILFQNWYSLLCCHNIFMLLTVGYTAYMDLMASVPKKADKLNLSLTVGYIYVYIIE